MFQVIWLVSPETAKVVKENFQNEDLIEEIEQLEGMKDMVRELF